MEKVFVVSISKHSESCVYTSEEERIVPRMTNGVLRIFESKDDAKKYIETLDLSATSQYWYVKKQTTNCWLDSLAMLGVLILLRNG